MVDRQEVFNFLMGLIVLGMVGVFMSVVYKATDSEISTRGHYTLRAEFKNSEGITTGSPVRISGVQVGKVYKKVLDSSDYAALVFLLVDEEVELPTDTLAAVSTDGIFGDSYIDLKPGNSKAMLKNDEEIIYTRDSVSLSDMLSKLSKFIK